ncbi:MAG: Fur family transcriptional regulator [Alphaproteobacteria bacterium]
MVNERPKQQPKQTDDDLAWMLRKCEQAGLKLTTARKIIIEVLLACDDHPDVEMIQSRASSKDNRISIATTYRALKSFHETGIIARHDFGDGRARYEVAIRQHHDHLIDIDSGEVIEFMDDTIEQLQQEIAKRLGYELTGHRLELYGKKIK